MHIPSMSATTGGCFLYAKFIRDTVSLILGGAAVYAIIRWRWIFLAIPAAPFGRWTKSYYHPHARHFESWDWWDATREVMERKIGPAIVVTLAIALGLVVAGIILVGIFHFFKWLYWTC